MTEHLASWNDGHAKKTVLDYVEAVTTNGPHHVEPADRIATFDNDGTLWVEKPAPPQFDFLFRVWTEAVKKDPSLATEQPYKAIVEQDQKSLAKAEELGWTVVSMKDDWATVFATEKP